MDYTVTPPKIDPGPSESIGLFEVRSTNKDLHDTHWKRSPKLASQALIAYCIADFLSQVVFDDPTISNKHIKVYSITYDQINSPDIKPLIYAEDLSSNGTYWNGALIGKANGAVLLSNGDTLRLSPRISLLFHTEVGSEVNEISGIQKLEMRRFKDSYRISSRKLGSGAQGSVYMAVHQQMGRQLACKIVDLSKIRQREFSKLRAMQSKAITRKMEEFTSKLMREVNILKDMNHPNIIRLEKVYYTASTVYIFEELITGGDLFSYIESQGGYLHEAVAGVIIRQVLEALNYLHSQGIVHRDIKPDNLLITSVENGARVVLTDFGSAIMCKPLEGDKARRMETLTGTLEYVAPEVQGLNDRVKEKGYTKAVDMWSVGCVTAALLTGASPFDISDLSSVKGNSNDAILRAAAECKLHKLSTTPEWERVGRRPKAFVKGLLALDENKRMTAQQALDHEWFTNKYHKIAFDAVYDYAVKNWKPRILHGEIIEKLRLSSESKQLSKDQFAFVRKPKQKLFKKKPIEPHYQPFHKNLDLHLSPARPTTSWPQSGDVSEEWQNLINRSDQISPLGFVARVASLSLSQPQDMPHQELPAFESLQLTDADIALTQNTSSDSSLSHPKPIPPPNVDSSYIEMDPMEETGKTCSEQKAKSNQHTDRSSQGLSVLEHHRSLSQESSVHKQHCQLRNPMGNGQLKRPAKSAPDRERLKLDKFQPTRKHRLKFDVNEDERTQVSKVNPNVDVDDCNVTFTPINRRQSCILGDTQSKGYWSNSDDSTDEEDTSIIKSDIAEDFKTPLKGAKRRRSTYYDYEEAAIYEEASKENRLFRTARSFGESVVKKRIEKTLQS